MNDNNIVWSDTGVSQADRESNNKHKALNIW